MFRIVLILSLLIPLSGCELLEALLACDKVNDPTCLDPEKGQVTGRIVVPQTGAAQSSSVTKTKVSPAVARALSLFRNDTEAQAFASKRPVFPVASANAAWAKEATTERWSPSEVIVRSEEPMREKKDAFAALMQNFLDDGTKVNVRLCNTPYSCLAELRTLDGKHLDALETFDVAQRLNTSPDLRFAEVNRILQMSRTPNDPFYPVQWHYGKLRLPAAWDITVGDDDIIAAVIDTGILSDHPDLAGRVTGGADLIDNESTSGDGDGRDDDGFDAGDNACGNGCHSHHGTHVAGTMAARTDNNSQVAGVAWEASLLAVRVLGEGGGEVFDIAGGVYWSIGSDVDGVSVNPTPADVINMSLGGSGLSETMNEAVADAVNQNTLVIVAAGNENVDAEGSTPANAPDAITIAALTNTGGDRARPQKASYSNFGAVVDMAAPGGEQAEDVDADGLPDGVLSTVRDEVTFYQGTSMAAPHVAGVAILMKSLDVNITQSQARTLLEQTADDNITCTGCGAGMVNAVQVLRAMQGTENEPLVIATQPTLRVGRDDLDVQVRFENAGAQSVRTTISVGGPDRAKVLGLNQQNVTIDAGETITLELTLDRSGVDSGSATVTAAYDGGAAETRILWSDEVVFRANAVTVGAFRIEGDDISPERLVQATSLNRYAYNLYNLTPGEYLIIGISDDDLDGNPGENGEGVGVFPRIQEVQLINVVAGGSVTDADFLVAPGFVEEDVPISGNGAVGAACASSSECLSGLYCERDVFAGGYCTRDCSAGNPCDNGSACFCLEASVGGDCSYSVCLDQCTQDSDCRTGEGYACDADNTCYPQ